MRLSILTFFLIALAAAPLRGQVRGQVRGQAPATRPSFEIGHVDHPPIREASGLVASRRQPGVFWTHNDSGNSAQLFAIDRTGRLLGQWTVGARNHDWEDIAIDGDRIYIADIGNNGHRRAQVQVLEVAEPTIGQADDQPLAVLRAWQLRYAEGDRYDAEALFIHKGHGYIVSKELVGREARLASFPLEDPGGPVTLRRRGTLPVRAPVTAADLDAEGRWLAVATVTGPRVFEINGDLARIADAPAHALMYLNPTMEAIAVVEEGLLAVTERRQVLLFTWQQLRGGPQALDETARAVRFARRAQPLEVDGWLREWQAIAPLDLQGSRPGDSAATLRGAWDDAGLWLAVTVPDPQVSDLVEHWFTGDCLEIFIGEDTPNRSADYGPADTRAYCGFRAEQVVLEWPRGDGPPSARAAGRRLDGSYEMELFLPRPGLQAGQTLRLEVSALSRQPRANWFLNTPNEAGTWMTPLKWAVLTLE